jgi:murein DD-endopeptidase MepM/ murein hydrolase activator NlpD
MYKSTTPAADPAPIPAVAPPSNFERIEPLTFAESETQHVRNTRYDPFKETNRLEIDLDELSPYFHYPLSGNRTSDYGMRGRSMHSGIDIQASPGDTVRAALSGVVRMSKSYSGYGNTVVIRHPNGLETVYAHHAENFVRTNDLVQAGEPIAIAGRTGQATGVHLHFETRVAGEHFDPNLLIDTERHTLRRGTLHLTRSGGRILASNSLPRESSTFAYSTSTSIPSASPQSVAAAKVHEVHRGDTLFSISRHYGVSIDRLCNLNGISRESILSIGQKIKLN